MKKLIVLIALITSNLGYACGGQYIGDIAIAKKAINKNLTCYTNNGTEFEAIMAVSTPRCPNGLPQVSLVVEEANFKVVDLKYRYYSKGNILTHEFAVNTTVVDLRCFFRKCTFNCPQ